MSAGEAVVLGAVLIGLVLAAAVLVVLRDVRRDLEGLRAELHSLAVGAATIDDLEAAVRAAIPRGPGDDASADPVPASRVPQVLRTGPVVKAMALGSGTAHVARKLAGRNGH